MLSPWLEELRLILLLAFYDLVSAPLIFLSLCLLANSFVPLSTAEIGIL